MKTRQQTFRTFNQLIEILVGGTSIMKNFYRIFILPKKHWRRPSICEILIYDAVGSSALIELLHNRKYLVVPTRGESVNLYILLRATLKRSFWSRGQTINTYIATFAENCNSKLIITFIDNNTEFYSLSKLVLGCTTMMIQNGTRDGLSDIKFDPSNSRDYRVDFMLVHTPAQGDFYREKINGTSIAVGSIKNNSVKREIYETSRTVVFISQFRPKNPDNKFLITNLGETVDWNNYFTADAAIFRFLLAWCKSHDYKLSVCGCQPATKTEEYLFFQSLCTQPESFIFHPRQGEFESYKQIDASEIVVTIDSTLGFESLARGKKTAFFYNRNVDVVVSQLFGWPAFLPFSGPFWSNSRSLDEFERVINSVASVTTSEFRKLIEPYKSDLMVWDPENHKTKTLIETIVSRN